MIPPLTTSTNVVGYHHDSVPLVVASGGGGGDEEEENEGKNKQILVPPRRPRRAGVFQATQGRAGHARGRFRMTWLEWISAVLATGGGFFSMIRICTGDVCVRRTVPGFT